MKYVFYFISISFLFACSTHNEPGDVITSEFERITTVLTKDVWQVEEFSKNDTLRTAEFEGFEFVFKENNSFSVEKDSLTSGGRWEYKSLPFEGELMDLEAEAIPPLELLSETWTIESVINRQVKLKVETENGMKVLILARL